MAKKTAELAKVTRSPIALEALVDRANGYAADAKASNTRRAYTADFGAFEAWCSARGVASLPTTPGTVAVYIAAMADEGRKPSTIERALAGIAHTQRAHGHEWPKGHAGIREVMSGIRRRRGTAATKKAPVMGNELALLVGTLEGDLAGLRDRALLTLGWFGAFRRSELVALVVADVVFVNEGMTVTMRRSKTDQEGKGDTKGIPYAGNPALCPVRAVRSWLDAAKVAEGCIFRAVDRHGHVGEDLDARSVARIVQRAAKDAGLDAVRFGGHSLRAGFATTAAKSGKSLDAIMRQTGHRSERVARGYIRHASLFDDNAASGLA